MEQDQVKIKTKRYFNCLVCDKGIFWVEHLLDGSSSLKNWGTWYCDHCGEGHAGTVVDTPIVNQKKIEAHLTHSRRDWKSVLLKLEPDAGDVYLTVKGMSFTEYGDMLVEPVYEDHARYFYEEHTCPTNYLRNVIEILQVMPNGQESTDPHGIFEYIGSAPLYTDEGRLCDDVQDRLQYFQRKTNDFIHD